MNMEAIQRRAVTLRKGLLSTCIKVPGTDSFAICVCSAMHNEAITKEASCQDEVYNAE